MRRPVLALALAAGLAGGATSASGMSMPGDGGSTGMGGGRPALMVGAAYAAFLPHQVSAVTGDTVTWKNQSVRAHTVTAEGFSSYLASGASYSHTFAAPGTYLYHCTLHPTMTGEIDVADLLLDPQPLPAAPGRPFPISGRAAPGIETVEIQGDDGSGAGFTPAATATVADDGTFTATITPATSTTYRAAAGDETSAPIQLVVVDHQVAASVHRMAHHRFAVTGRVTPAAPGDRLVLQLRLRERFGWWPVASRKLGGRTRAMLMTRHRGHVMARLVLTLPDGATPLAVSPTFHVG